MFSINSVKSSTNKRCFQSFLHFSSYSPACYKIVQCFLQVTLAFGLFTESQVEEHFRTLLILELLWIFNYMLYTLSTACQSKYRICISWKRPVRARFTFPRRPVPVCPVEHSVQNCHQIAISCVSSYPSQFTACPQPEI